MTAYYGAIVYSERDFAMRELTSEQLHRQDFVDNSIFELIQALNPSGEEIEWDIEMIGEIRDCVEEWLVVRLQVADSGSFYP